MTYIIKDDTRKETGLTLSEKDYRKAKVEHIGDVFVIDKYSYTLEDINPEDEELFITTTTDPSGSEDCRWSQKFVDEHIEKLNKESL